MTRSRVKGGAAGLATLAVFGLLFVLSSPEQKNELRAAQDKPAKPRPPGKPIAMPGNLVSVELTLGLKDEKPTGWGGEVRVSRGRVLETEIVRGGARARTEGATWRVGSVRRRQGMRQVLDKAVVRISLDAPDDAEVTVQTRQHGKFSFKLSDLGDAPKRYLDGQASAERRDGALRLTGTETEDDYPALAKGKDGTIWLAYVEYQPGKPLVKERVLSGQFDELMPKGNGDCVRLVRFDGKTWQPALDVTATGLDVWRPTVAVDGKGNVVVAWAQRVKDDWDIYTRTYTPPAKEGGKGAWSKITAAAPNPGSDFHVVAAADSAGSVWLAWQSWQKNNFDILLLPPTGAEGRRPQPFAISHSKANDWCPAIAADNRGNVYVAWDTYDKGNYDVRLRRAGRGGDKEWAVATSPKFEARPNVVCDDKGRVWVAYEEGDEQWGKDFSTNQFKKVGFEKNPGFALYINRTVRVKCLLDGKIRQPAESLEDAFKGKLTRGKSVPRLTPDGSGGLWLLLRHHPLRGGRGEVWNSYALRYDGKAWSGPRQLPGSANLLDNRPALIAHGKGLLAVYSGDGRNRTRNREQTDLFTALLPGGEVHDPIWLKGDAPPAKAKLAPVHPNETEDVARMRDYRIESGDKKLRLLRGEFHRHTEYTAHRDGDGLLEDSFRYALDAGNLDWMGNGDHDNGAGHEYMWWQIQKVTDLFHNPPHFVAAQTYERSNRYPNGHRNVMMPRRGIRPLPRGDLMGTEDKGTPDTKILYAYLKHFGGICSSHTSGTNMGTDWRDSHPEFEPVVEIYQGHRHNYEHKGAPRSATQETHIGGYQPKGTVWNAFEKGIRMGFQSSSDHISTHMSYAVVLTDDASRKGLIDAFKKRHCYAATDNIVVEVRSGEHLMGDEFTTDKRPTLKITVRGTAPVAKLHVIRDNKYVYSTEPKKAEVDLTYTDMDAKKGKTSYYYVRVEQADGNLAWASPMWITYK